MNSNRIKWIDTAKLLGIFFVILGHISLENKVLVNFIYSFHMPLFFFLAGITSKEEPLTNSFKKNAKHLLIPYLFFYIIAIIRYILRHLSDFYNDALGIIIKLLFGLILGVGYDTDNSIMANHHLWFIPALFIVKILFQLINNIFIHKHMWNVIFMFVFILTSYVISRTQILLPFSIGSAFLSYPFFISGFLLKNIIIHILQYSGNKIKVLLTFLVLIIEFYMITIININDINKIQFGNIFVFYVKAYIGIGCVILLSNFISMNKYLDVLSRNTIIILSFHSITTGIILYLCNYLNLIEDISSISSLFGILVSISSLTLNYIPIVIINKYCPYVLGK